MSATLPASIERLLDESERHPAAWWLDAVRHEERRGELLTAFDLAERGLEEHPDDLALKHRAVLALARTGATEEAARRFDHYGLGETSDEEVAALRARIAKDIALACAGDERRRKARSAAELYGGIFERTASYYPAINAATLWLMGGEPDRARRLAEIVLGVLGRGEDRSYWAVATEAEAHLLRGDQAAASRALELAAAPHDRDYAALATTRRQLRLICEVEAIDPQLLDRLAGPDVVHFCGHRIADGERPRFPAEAEAAVATRINEVVKRDAPGFAYGSLAAGADILWAEGLLAVGAEVHVVLPFARAKLVEASARANRDEMRIVRAMLFADISRFSQLTDEATLIFGERVFGAFATVLQQHRHHLTGRRTWGDALFLVFTDAPAAASCALASRRQWPRSTSRWKAFRGTLRFGSAAIWVPCSVITTR